VAGVMALGWVGRAVVVLPNLPSRRACGSSMPWFKRHKAGGVGCCRRAGKRAVMQPARLFATKRMLGRRGGRWQGV